MTGTELELSLAKPDVISFLKSKGLPGNVSDKDINVGDHGNVDINNISSETCQDLIKNISFAETREKFFGRPIYCRATRELTPVKPSPEVNRKGEDASKDEEDDSATSDTTNETAAFGDFLEENGFEFEPAVPIESKHFKGPCETSEAETGVEADSEEEVKDPGKTRKTPNKSKKKRKERSSPNGTNEKVEKKLKN